MVVCCGLVYEVGMRNTPDVGTVVVGLARNDACWCRVVACFTIGYNTLEGVTSIVAGLIARSVSLVGFGLDSLIEVTC